MWTNQRERCSLQALHLMSRSIKKCNSGVFWELCMCCQHDEYSHNICVTTTTKNRSKKCFRGFKVCSDYEHTTNGGNSLPSGAYYNIKENYRRSKTPRNLKYEYLAKVWVCLGLRW